MKLVATGCAVGLSQLPGMEFDGSKPYIFCRICGELRQTTVDREATTPLELFDALELRRLWSKRHERRHSDKEHTLLALSGRFLTPEAASKLAAFGVIDLVGLAVDEEMISAYAECSPVPRYDASY